MNQLNNLLMFDMYHEQVKLKINGRGEMRTFLGLFMSFLTFLIWILIFYIELYEVIVKEKPNISTNKINSQFYNQSISFNPNTIKFFLRKNRDDKYLSKYFKLESNLFLSEYNDPKKNSKFSFVNHNKPFDFIECDSNEIPEVAKGYLTDDSQVLLCPRNFNLDDFAQINRFDFALTFAIRKCFPYETDCSFDDEVFDKFKDGTLTANYQLLFYNPYINFFSHDHPFEDEFNVYDLSPQPQSRIHTLFLKTKELVTLSNYLFENKHKEAKFAIKDHNIEKNTYLRSEVNINYKLGEIEVIRRNYKTLLTALANSYSLIKIFSIFVLIFMRYYTSYSIEEIVYNRNFEHINSDTDTSRPRRDVNLLTRVEVSKPLVRRPSKKITVGRMCLNTSCWRYLCCKGSNNDLRFYNKASYLFREYTSVENIIYLLMDYVNLKNSLSGNKGVTNFDRSRAFTDLKSINDNWDNFEPFVVNELRLDQSYNL
jgi:hypothetical protein